MPRFDVSLKFGMVFDARDEFEAVEIFLNELHRMIEEGELEEYVTVLCVDVPES